MINVFFKVTNNITLLGFKSCKKHANQGHTLKNESLFMHKQCPSHETYKFHVQRIMVFHSPICIAWEVSSLQFHD